MQPPTVSDRTRPGQIAGGDRFTARGGNPPRVEAARRPMATPVQEEDGQAWVRGQWRDATVEAIHAQIAYAELVSQDTADDDVFAEAWLRLWRAQQHQRELSVALDQMDT
jgi:hypothetical protein